jgi:3-hydroxyacyl-[acyl-carrier-protein] dehydratase
MPVNQRIIDSTAYSLDHVIAGAEAIHRYNPQRFEFEQLSAVVYDDPQAHIVVGYKDVTEADFWVRGHLPGQPFMPGVVMCEAAAQLCSYFTHKHHLLGDCELVGLGGMEDIRFRDPVRPGDRLVVVCQQTKVRLGAIILCRFQAFVGESMVVEGKIKGVPLPVSALVSEQKTSP